VYVPRLHTARPLLALAALIVAFAMGPSGPASAAAATIQLGAYVPNGPEDGNALDAYAAMVGQKPDIVMKYSNPTDPLLTPAEISNLESRGETPMVTWQLYKSSWSGPTIPLSSIAAGNYDTYLRRAADLAKSLPFDVMIRFGHEMNGNWYGWSGQPAAYVAAWRHVVSVFRGERADNVKWVWSPNVDNGDYPFTRYFPGDSWVDYLALDGYNWGHSGVGVNQWQSLSQVFSSSYRTLTQLSSKPVILAETSSSEIGGDKAAWIRQGFLKTIPQQFPRVRAVLWFDRDMEQDWRVNSSSSALQAFRDVASSSLYGGPDPAPSSTEQSAKVQTLTVTPSRLAGRSSGATKTTVSRAKVAYRLSHSARLKISVRDSRGHASAPVTIAQPSKGGRVALSKLVGGRHMRRGGYRVVARAVNRSGSHSKPRQARFRIV